MKKGLLFLVLLLMVSVGGCTNEEDFTQTITSGTWRVSYFISGGDEHTLLFRGYVFTFTEDGSVAVVRPGEPAASGRWDVFSSDTRLDLDFIEAGPLQKLHENWVVDSIRQEEILLHELGAPFNQVTLLRL